MAGIAPARVQHCAIRIKRASGEEYTPVWDEAASTWGITIEKHEECTDLLHQIMHGQTGEDYKDCTGGHEIVVTIRFRRGAYRQGLRPWRGRCRVAVDDALDLPVNFGEMMALLAKPTNPQGEGKKTTASADVPTQQMRTKKTTVIRV